MYRFRFDSKNYEDCDSIEKVNELIKNHDYFIISTIEDDTKAPKNTMKQQVSLSWKDGRDKI